MGWGDCGDDSQGRPIGYNFSAVCDHPECDEKIDRGLAYVCGDMHGEDCYSCEKYYCYAHRNVTVLVGDDVYAVCGECEEGFKDKDSGVKWDEFEGAWHPEEQKPCGCRDHCPEDCKGECGCRQCKRNGKCLRLAGG